MTASTAGFEVRARSRHVRDAIELVSSMRFSISLLTLICVASIIGTVVKQNEPFNNYVNQFGPFWADVFAQAALFNIYSAPWFLLILGFLVLSTSLCIARNLPKIMVDLKAYKEHVRVQSLQAFRHKAQGVVAEDREATFSRVNGLLAGGGWKARAQVRDNGVMVAARKGSSNKIGYLAAHGAIVLICVGGLLDGDLIVRLQMALLGKEPYTGSGLISEVPDAHRLSERNPTYRGNVLVPEGARAGTAILSMPGGVVLQPLPFDIELKKFIVEYYATGMPKLFASEVLIHDRATGRVEAATVEVNKPAFHCGDGIWPFRSCVAIYQSSFDDGGSRVALRGIPMKGAIQPFDVQGRVGGSTELVAERERGEEKMTLEFSGLRVINVENFSGGGSASGTDVRKVDLATSLDNHLGSGVKVANKKELRNVGPSVSYKIRDEAGQAREFNNYMLPVELDGQRVFLVGVRENPQDTFRYLRIPADDEDRIDGWSRLRQALDDPAQREQAAKRYVAKASPADKPEVGDQLLITTQRVLALFAGAEAGTPQGDRTGGLQGLADFMEGNVPEAERGRISEVLLRVLNGSLFELLNLTREKAGKAPLPPGEKAEGFMSQAVMSLSDSFLYPAPVLFELKDFTQVQASVFQVARAPGKTLVYLGSTLLIIGVFVMLYVRERRLWIWIEADAADPTRTRITGAMSATRHTMDQDAEFDRIRKALLKEAS